jgi:hypothetical protein
VNKNVFDGSDREPEDRHDAVHRLVLPTYCAASVSRIVPVTRTGGEKKYDSYFKLGHSYIYEVHIKNQNCSPQKILFNS